MSRAVCFSTSEVFGSRAFGSSETDLSVIGGPARRAGPTPSASSPRSTSPWRTTARTACGVTVLRPFNVYGPGQVGEGALRNFIQWAIRDEPIEIHGDGTQIRAWCYIDDMVDGVLLALRPTSSAVGESFNIGNRRSAETILGLANTVLRVLRLRSHDHVLASA